MLRMITEETIKEAAKRLADKFHPDRIILFGSYARGTADKHSDVDLLVICRVKKNRRKLAVEMDMTLWGLGMARDIVLLTPKEYEVERQIPGTIARYAWKEGRALYDHKR
ncbi:MAG: nucleotidyltransferase domain-containing protein [Deltaproteobacteria bacterium]